MTTGLSGIHAIAPDRPLYPQPARQRAVVLALLAVLCVVAVPASIGWIGRPPDPNEARPAADPRPGRREAPAAPSAGRELRPEIDALATLVAKRYRISSAATRGMVAAAYREAQRAGLDPLLVVAVIAVESRFNPIAESDAGAQGLMQVIPEYHKDHIAAAGVASVLDPHENIRLGTRILKEYIRRGGTVVAGLQSYNGAADDASNAYAGRVLAERQRLQRAVERVRSRLHV
jgi:soluble lytic murein transglycosylase-like protein